MRYLVQFIIPALIFIAVVLFANQRRSKSARAGGEQESSDFGMFIAILIVGAAAAVAIAWLTHTLWDPAA